MMEIKSNFFVILDFLIFCTVVESLKKPKNSPNSQDENQQRPTNFKRPLGNKPSNTPGQSELERSATLAAMLKSRMYCYLCSAKVIIYFIILVNDYAPSDLKLPLRQWGAGNVYLLVLSKDKR